MRVSLPLDSSALDVQIRELAVQVAVAVPSATAKIGTDRWWRFATIVVAAALGAGLVGVARHDELLDSAYEVHARWVMDCTGRARPVRFA